jgi:hypothetical protein
MNFVSITETAVSTKQQICSYFIDISKTNLKKKTFLFAFTARKLRVKYAEPPKENV